VNGLPLLPEKPFVGNFSGDTEAVDWALLWLPEGGELLTESYVNLIPTMQGGRTLTACVRGCWTRCASSANTAISCRAA
jgi:topoisomerase-4 subunit B